MGAVALGLIPLGVGMVLDRLVNLGYVGKDAMKDTLWLYWLAWTVVFFVPVIWLPRRTIMDWVARTYLVPR